MLQEKILTGPKGLVVLMGEIAKSLTTTYFTDPTGLVALSSPRLPTDLFRRRGLFVRLESGRLISIIKNVTGTEAEQECNLRHSEEERVTTIPVWSLLGFAGWTLITLFSTIGIYRWSRILTGRSEIKEWRADVSQGSELYRRAMRAHANCVENLPVYVAVVLAIVASGASGHTLDALAVVILPARVLHTIIHVSFEQTNLVAGFRFAFFFVQIVCMFWMGILVSLKAAG